MIPKIIHLCWVGGGEYPPLIKKCVESFSRVNPSYEIFLWDRNKFDVESTLWTKQAFEKKKYAFVADYIRFYALYHYGGIYLDSDIECVKPFDDLLNRPYFFGKEFEQFDNIEAACIGCEPNLEWVKCCLDYYTDRPFIKEDGTIDDIPMPKIMANRLKTFYPEVMKSMLPADYFDAKDFYSRKVKVTENTYTIHHMIGSWLRGEDYLYNNYRKRLLKYLPGRLASMGALLMTNAKSKGFIGVWSVCIKTIDNLIRKYV